MVEIPEHANITLHAEIIRRLMIEAMRLVVPGIKVDVQYAVSKMWSKCAEATFDEAGRLTAWRPSIRADAHKPIEKAAIGLAVPA